MFEAVHVERVIRHLLRFGSSPADAEDLAQEALVIAWRKERERDRDRSLDGWLYGIARNVYRNHSRTLRRRAEQPIAAREGAVDAEALSFPDAVAVRDALTTLPEDLQDVVILHELEQYTLKETASLLSIPFYTAKDRLRRARAGLRSHMQAELAEVVPLERRATRRIAKASAPLVVAAVLASLPRSALAGTGAYAAATGGLFSTGAAKLGFAGLLTAGLVVGVAAQQWMSSGSAESVTAPVPTRPLANTDRAGVDRLHTGTVAEADAGRETGAAKARAGAPAREAEAKPSAEARGEARAAARVKRSGTPPVRVVDAESTATSPATTSSEAQLVERARVALRDGRADEAVRTLMAHERRFPAGQLAEERDVLLVEAYLTAGNRRLATRRLEHYRASYPSGLHRQRADQAARELARGSRS